MKQRYQVRWRENGKQRKRTFQSRQAAAAFEAAGFRDPPGTPVHEWGPEAEAALPGYIYGLLKGGELVYVGQTVNLSARLAIHRRRKAFDRALFMIVPRAAMNFVEGELIERLKPRLNEAPGPVCGRWEYEPLVTSLLAAVNELRTTSVSDVGLALNMAEQEA